MTCPSCDPDNVRDAAGRVDMDSTWDRCDPCAEREHALWERFKDSIIVPPPVIRRER